MICFRVAQSQGGDMFTWAALPFQLTAYAFLMLLSRERATDVQRNAEGLRAANRAAIAFHEPDRLGAEHAELQRELGILPSVEDAKEHGLRVLSAAQQLGWIPSAPAENPA